MKEYMDKEAFLRKWSGTHTELQAMDKISKKQMKHIYKAKREIEKSCAEDRLEKLSQFMIDAVAVRKDEVLNKKSLPIKDLINLTIKAHPQRAKVETTGNINFTFADMVSKASVTFDKLNTIDTDKESDE